MQVSRLTLLDDSPRVLGIDAVACSRLCCDQMGEGIFFRDGGHACHVYEGGGAQNPTRAQPFVTTLGGNQIYPSSTEVRPLEHALAGREAA